MVRRIEGFVVGFGGDVELGGLGEFVLFLLLAFALEFFQFLDEFLAQAMETHFLNLQVAELAFVSEVGVHAQHGEARTGIEVRHFGYELVAALYVERFFDTGDAVDAPSGVG